MLCKMSKGMQITIPANWRTELGLQRGSTIELVKERGRILIIPAGEDLEEILKKAKKIRPKHGLTARQMDELNERLLR